MKFDTIVSDVFIFNDFMYTKTYDNKNYIVNIIHFPNFQGKQIELDYCKHLQTPNISGDKCDIEYNINNLSTLFKSNFIAYELRQEVFILKQKTYENIS